MTAENWMLIPEQLNKKPLVIQAADAGHDVWMANSRGTRYSLEHKSLNATTDKAYWDFSWSEEGIYDGPANIKKIVEVTGYEKVAFIGFSLGTMQMFYALTKDEDNFFKDHVSVFIALAPCTRLTNSNLGYISMSQTVYDWYMSDIMETGITSFYGPTWE